MLAYFLRIIGHNFGENNSTIRNFHEHNFENIIAIMHYYYGKITLLIRHTVVTEMSIHSDSSDISYI